MSYYILISLCVIILIAYFFEITSRITRIPGVILLIILGMALNYFFRVIGFTLPDFSLLLPVMGTLGLVLIVLEGSLDLKVGRDKKRLMIRSFASAGILFFVFVFFFAILLSSFFDYDFKNAFLNAIPLGIISSAVAIPSSSNLASNDREFIVYESSVSDILGIIVFDFVLFNGLPVGKAIMGFTLEIIMTILFSILISAMLAYLLHKVTHHIKYVIILTFVVLIYTLANLIHWPSLIVVLIFGLILNNNNLFQFDFIKKRVDFGDFNAGLKSFKQITGELTFLVRSFFFLIFGFYTSLESLLNLNSLIVSLSVSASFFILRALFFKYILRKPLFPLLWFAPRGLITILLFMTIPEAMRLPLISEGVVVQTIFITTLTMTFGNILYGRDYSVAPEISTNNQI